MDPRFFSQNRKNLVTKLDANSLALVFSAEPAIRNGDQLHPWRQDSNFFYLTGLEQPGLKLLLIPEKGNSHQEILFIPKRDPKREQWEGAKLSIEVASQRSGIKKVMLLEDFEAYFFKAQEYKEQLFTEINPIFPRQPITENHRFLAELGLRLPGLQVKKLAPFLVPLRARKQKPELEQLKKSLTIIDQGLRRVAQFIEPGVLEYQVEAELSHHYLFNGCPRLGFETIVAGGANACTLHYIENDQPLKDRDLVLVDTGAEYGMYSGDVTRVFPVNGKFTDRQRHCYEAVLEVNKTFIRKLRANLSWQELAQEAGKIQGEVYKRYGLIEDSKDYLKVGYHRIGHSLGLDVHDVQIQDWPLRPGAVITVEPGLYLPEEGIGIRIEDDVLLTETGAEVLSASIPKEVAAIEDLMRRT